MKYIFCGVDMFFCGIIMYILYPFLPSNIWIISERADQAQDNGVAFFEYLNKEQKNINSFYLLEKNCKEISSVEKIGNVLIKGTLKHKILFLKSRVLASTEKNIIEPWGSRIFYRIFTKVFPKKLKVFLQHGITDKDVSDVYGKSVSDIDLFVTATKDESIFIEDKFGYDHSEIADVGFCRYDKLVNSNNNIENDNLILYMPTWRRYLFDLANGEERYLKKARNEFLKSNYYKHIQELIDDDELKDLLEKNNYKFVFIAHHGINKLSDLFTIKSKNIEIYKSEEVKITQLLSRAKIFITDYSSIHFDSAYIGNNNIYYQFDREEFFKGHAGKSYFSYENDGFGPVV
ncbi:MAG: CDP-glycerol glycerophosphotransferase family protein, partial [Romboutsia sp.]|nr:CDP-glycerol glycerophosphotransferase family protein [Romboutsia sp.]